LWRGERLRHPVLNSDPGVLAMLRSSRSDADKLVRYTRLETRSRFAFTPPLVAMVGVHSAVPVRIGPRSPWQHEEASGVGRDHGGVAFGPCPNEACASSTSNRNHAMMVGALAQADSMVDNCLAQPSRRDRRSGR